jgi:hypothetical protein
MALRLIAGQLPGGYWTYKNPPITEPQEQKLLEQLRTNTYKPHGVATHYASHSMTQFALLALWVSRRHDIPAQPALLASAAHFHNVQHPSGTWGYGIVQNSKQSVDSNTCAGLIALAMEKGLHEDKTLPREKIPPLHPRTEEQTAKAFAHLAKVIGRTKNDPRNKKGWTGTTFNASALGDLYFLWCLERVAVIYDLKEIGGKDWYAWGAEVLVESQKADGSWVDKHGDVLDTCFALLFLTRANLAKDLTQTMRARGPG